MGQVVLEDDHVSVELIYGIAPLLFTLSLTLSFDLKVVFLYFYLCKLRSQFVKFSIYL